MSAAREAADIGDPKVDLTPMIDMVFQLIIFFIVVSDFSSTQLEPVVLPDAIRADTEKSDEKERSVIINVLADGTTKINRQVFAGIDPKTGQKLEYSVLKNQLRIEAEFAGTEENPESKGKQMSKLRVVIRADQHCPYEFVSNVFKACAENGIYKTQIQANKDLLKPAG